MSDIAVRVEGLSKKFRIGARQEGYKTFRESLIDAMQSPFRRLGALLGGSNGRGKDPEDTIWALKDISFEVKQGEVVGIIGRNGAGKSTLLKILTRITEPTTGRAEILGRVGSLLEVGTGFHPELTGRENIFLNGAILGMRKVEIARRFDEIVAFSEVEKFIDTPVKRYSSGMYLRLAFAVAAHLDPEIMLVDEVLAVGDAAFQKKCLGKMGEVAQAYGRTILFVSHNMVAIRRLCARAILLDAGQIAADGSADEVISSYIKGLVSEQDTQAIWREEFNPPEYRDWFRLTKIVIVDEEGIQGNVFTSDKNMQIQIHYTVNRDLKSVRFSLHLENFDGVHVLASTDTDCLSAVGVDKQPGNYITRCHLPSDFLSPNNYHINLGVYQYGNKIIAGANNIVSFQVIENNGPIFPKRIGVVNPLLEWEVEEVKHG